MGTKLKSFKPKKLSRKTKYQFDLYSSGYKIFGKRPKLISSVTIRPLPRGM